MMTCEFYCPVCRKDFEVPTGPSGYPWDYLGTQRCPLCDGLINLYSDEFEDGNLFFAAERGPSYKPKKELKRSGGLR